MELGCNAMWTHRNNGDYDMELLFNFKFIPRTSKQPSQNVHACHTSFVAK